MRSGQGEGRKKEQAGLKSHRGHTEVGKKVDAFHTDWRAFFKQCTLDLDGKEVKRQIQELNQAHGVQPTSSWGNHTKTGRDIESAVFYFNHTQ